MEDGDPKHHHHQQSHAPAGYGQDVPARSDIDEILRRKRKAREYKARTSHALSDDLDGLNGFRNIVSNIA